jgi:hypothetical protein
MVMTAQLLLLGLQAETNPSSSSRRREGGPTFYAMHSYSSKYPSAACRHSSKEGR